MKDLNRTSNLWLCFITTSFLVAEFAISSEPIVITAICTLRPLDEVAIAARRDGRLIELSIRKGEFVSKDARLARIDDADAIAALQVSNAKYAQSQYESNNESQLHLIETQLKKSAKEFDLVTQLGDDAPYLERFRAGSAKIQGLAQLEAAQNDRTLARLRERVAAAERSVAQREVDECVVLAPFAGMITRVHRQQHEWASRGESLVTLTRLERLQFVASVPRQDFLPQQLIGARARLTIPLGVGESPWVIDQASITAVDSESVEGDRYLIIGEIENQFVQDAQGKQTWVLRPGMRGELQVIEASQKGV